MRTSLIDELMKWRRAIRAYVVGRKIWINFFKIYVVKVNSNVGFKGT